MTTAEGSKHRIGAHHTTGQKKERSPQASIAKTESGEDDHHGHERTQQCAFLGLHRSSLARMLCVGGLSCFVCLLLLLLLFVVLLMYRTSLICFYCFGCCF